MRAYTISSHLVSPCKASGGHLFKKGNMLHRSSSIAFGLLGVLVTVFVILASCRPYFRLSSNEVRYWHKAVENEPASSNKRLLLAIALRDAGRLDEAETELREAVRLNPANAGAKFELATILCKKGELVEARTLLAKIIQTQSVNNSNASKKWVGKAQKALKECEFATP